MEMVMKSLIKMMVPVILITGCHHEKHDDAIPSETVYQLTDLDSVNIESFELIKKFDATGQFGIPSEIRLVNPETLAILDNRSNRQIKIFNIKSGQITEVLAHGHGPNEMIAACSISVFDDKIYVGGINDNKICVIDSVDFDSPVIRQIYTADFAFLNILPIDNDRFLMLPLVPERIRYFELDISESSKKTVGSFPIVDSNANNAVFQADLALSPNHETIVAVNRSWGTIEIISSKDYSTQTIIRCPNEIQPSLKKVTTPNGTQYIQTPMGISLVNVCATDKGFFTGYVGSYMDKPETADKRISKILYFNYDGSDGKSYNLPTEITSFCIDPNDNKLYGLVYTPDGTVSIMSKKLL